MNNTNKVAALILGAAVGVALVKFCNMPKKKREEFYDHLKNTTHELLDNAEDTVEKVEHFMDEYNSKGKNEWIDKLYILKKMFRNFYGSDKHYLL
ncbi:MAG: YtxH domain-containing protein [Ginsengibacter sp.]